MKNLQYKHQKSIITSITATSTENFPQKRYSIQVKRPPNKNLSQKLFEKYMLNGLKDRQVHYRQKITPKRYETLTANSQVGKRQSKKSKSFSNNIYFPHGNILSIDESIPNKQKLKLSKSKAKTEHNAEQFSSLNRNNKKQNDLSIIVHKNETQINEDKQLSFLAKLNLQKRNKIMQIYRPKVKQLSKSRKIKEELEQKGQQKQKVKQQLKHQSKNKLKQAQESKQRVQLQLVKKQFNNEIKSQKQLILNKDNKGQWSNVQEKQKQRSRTQKNIRYENGDFVSSIHQKMGIRHLILDNDKSRYQNVIKFDKKLLGLKNEKMLQNQQIKKKLSNEEVKKKLSSEENKGVRSMKKLNVQSDKKLISKSIQMRKSDKNEGMLMLMKQDKLVRGLEQKRKELRKKWVKQQEVVQNKKKRDGQIKVQQKQKKIIQQHTSLNLPKYLNFYDNYISQEQIHPYSTQCANANINQQPQTQNHPLSFELHNLIQQTYSPLISHAKATQITPKLIEEPCPNSAKDQFDQCNSTNQALSHKKMFQKLKNQLIKSKKHTSSLSILNDFITNTSSSQNLDFKIHKNKNGTYFGQTNELNKFHGIGIIFYKSGKLFQGSFVNGEKDGQGYQLYPDGSFFLGCYQKDKKNGKGRFEWPNGQIYDGQWMDDNKHGSGQWKAANKISYAGQWKNNRIEGFGVLVQGNQRYEGQFINFMKHGHGTYRYENRQLFTGKFKSNRLNGKGQYFWPNGDHYKGEFVNNKRHGRGALYLHALRLIYGGQFRNDKKCGFGQEIYQNRIKYVGNFENDLKHGWGILKRIIGDQEGNQETIYQGYWVNNQTIQMSQTPLNQFNVIHQQEGQYLKNDLSKSNVKQKKVLTHTKISPQKLMNFSPYKKASLSKVELKEKLKQKQPSSLKGRSRYMRINNHYIKKSLQISGANSLSNSRQRLQKSKSQKNIGKLNE